MHFIAQMHVMCLCRRRGVVDKWRETGERHGTGMFIER